MKKIIISLFIFSSAIVFSDNGSFGYDGFIIGETKAEIVKLVQARYPWYQIDYKQKNEYSGCNDIIVRTGLGVNESKITFQFNMNEKLYLIIVTVLNPEDKLVDNQIETIKNKYGKPASGNIASQLLWDIQNNKYIICLSTSPLLIKSQLQKYSFFEMRFWNREALDDVYNHDI
jgi:hypothetical protein